MPFVIIETMDYASSISASYKFVYTKGLGYTNYEPLPPPPPPSGSAHAVIYFSVELENDSRPKQ